MLTTVGTRAATAVFLLDAMSYRLLATLPPQAGLQDAHAAVMHLEFLADGLNLVSQTYRLQLH